MRRQLTVSTLRRQWSNVYSQVFYGEPVPYIRLAGNWMAQAGFEPGQKVSVTVGDTGLYIQPEARPQ